MQLTGGCFCCELRYEADISGSPIGICHCRDCQIFSGSAFRMAVAVAPNQFSVTKGTPKEFDKTAESGKVRRMLFCGTCGTHLCSVPTENEEGSFVSIRIATADQFDELAPMVELYCDSKVGWMPDLEGTVRFGRMPEP